jgi:hypothetical protein
LAIFRKIKKTTEDQKTEAAFEFLRHQHQREIFHRKKSCQTGRLVLASGANRLARNRSRRFPPFIETKFLTEAKSCKPFYY